MKKFTPFALVALCLVGANALYAQEVPQAFVGARIISTGLDIANGTLVVEEGRITAVGPATEVSIPENAVRHDVSDSVLMPGLVDTHSHVGGPEGGDNSAPLQPDVRVIDSINVKSAKIQKAQAGGITTANIMPGSGLLLSGQTVYVKYRDVDTIDDLVILNDDGSIAGGMKMANGTNPMRDLPGFPGTRAKSAALVREQFVKAQNCMEEIREAGDDPEEMPARDLRLEALVEVLEGKRIVHNHTHRHDDILTTIRLAEEFGYRMVLQHVTEAWKVADEIAASGYPASILVLDSPGGKLEGIDLQANNGAELERAGALVGYHTDDGITDSRFFLRQAAFGVREGMSREKALDALTIAGARMLGLEGRVGSLETGKDADFIILSGDPLSVYTHVLETWVDGVQVFDRSPAW